MKRTKEDYLRVLNETIGYYSVDITRRGVTQDIFENAKCTYYSPEGKMCAVGRCLEKPKKFIDVTMNASHIINVNGGDRIFKAEYQGFSVIFWQDLQNLHDVASNWETRGLTASGLSIVQIIEARIDGGFYHNLT